MRKSLFTLSVYARAQDLISGEINIHDPKQSKSIDSPSSCFSHSQLAAVNSRLEGSLAWLYANSLTGIDAGCEIKDC